MTKVLDPALWLGKPPSSESSGIDKSKPIHVRGYRVFTNSLIMLIEAFDGEASQIENLPRLSELINIALKQEYHGYKISWENTWPKEEIVDCSDCLGSGRGSDKCPECEGSGQVTTETDYNTYDATCKSCSGKGKKRSSDKGSKCETCGGEGKKPNEYQPIIICGMKVPLHQIKMLKDVPDIMFSACEEKACLFWRSESDGCFGAISRLNV